MSAWCTSSIQITMVFRSARESTDRHISSKTRAVAASRNSPCCSGRLSAMPPLARKSAASAANASGPAICRNNSRAALKGSSCSSRAHTNSRQVTSRILASRMNSCTNAVFPHPAGPSSRTTWPRPSDDSLKRPRRMLDCRSRSNNCINFAFLMTPRSPTAPPPVTSLPLFERQGIPGNTSHIVATAVRGNLSSGSGFWHASATGRTEFGEVPRRTGSQLVEDMCSCRQIVDEAPRPMSSGRNESSG